MINGNNNQSVIKQAKGYFRQSPGTLNAVLGFGLLCFLSGGTARADTFTFNFTGLSSSSASDSAIQTFMDSALGAAGSVSLVGAVGSGAPCPGDCSGGNGNYNGDAHVVGPNPGSSSYSLANKDGGTFIINNNVVGGGSNYINMLFTLAGGAQITSVSFDYEIFPDNTCPDENHGTHFADCGTTSDPLANLPDIELTTTAGGVGTAVWSNTAVVPGQAGGSTYTHSPSSGSGSNELAPQLIGSTSVTGLNTLDLDFLDWPATIGINDVVITTTGHTQSNPVPEPGSVVLLGTIAGLVTLKLRRRKA